ncbi:MAG: hypothetical protein AAF151_19105, partial [Cyanobacteria bacterium J06656_5]
MGRSQAQLNALIAELGASSLPQIVADISDKASLRELCTQTQVVHRWSLCPYRLSLTGPLFLCNPLSSCLGEPLYD